MFNNKIKLPNWKSVTVFHSSIQSLLSFMVSFCLFSIVSNVV
jgi:hypothetical protein